MQDRKALQAGTSHFLGQNFAKAQEIQFQGRRGQPRVLLDDQLGREHPADRRHDHDPRRRRRHDLSPDGRRPRHIIIQPVLHKAESKDEVMAFCDKLIEALKTKVYGGRVIEVEYDTRDLRGGDKTWQWIKRGAPIRLEVGPRDVAEGNVFMARRDKGPKDKQSLKLEEFVEKAADILQEIQDGLFARAKAFRKANTHVMDTEEAFYEFFKTPETADNENTPIHAGFVMAHFNGDPKARGADQERPRGDGPLHPPRRPEALRR